MVDGMPTSTVGNDDSFVAFMFGVVSLTALVLYSKMIVRFAWDLHRYYTTRRSADNGIVVAWTSLMSSVGALIDVLRNPAVLTEGARYCIANPTQTAVTYIPAFLKFAIRPKVLVLWLWLVLFSSVMYMNLTFDAHAILGIDRSASTTEIKRAYRSLAKIYHPDKNDTEAARAIFFNVRRAYKKLVDAEAFEKETANEGEFSMAFALPTFLTSRDHEGLILFSLLALLFGAPFLLWRSLMERNRLQFIQAIGKECDRLGAIVLRTGIEEDPKVVNQRASRQALLSLLEDVRLAPKGMTLDQLAPFPPFVEFVQRCRRSDTHRAFFYKAEFDDEGIRLLEEEVERSGDDRVKAYEATLRTDDASRYHPVSSAAARVNDFFFDIHVRALRRELEALSRSMNGMELTASRKLLHLVTETQSNMRLLTQAGSSTTPPARVVRQLAEAPRDLKEGAAAVEREVGQIIAKSVKNAIIQQQGKQTYKSMVRAHRQQSVRS